MIVHFNISTLVNINYGEEIVALLSYEVELIRSISANMMGVER
jgi:hypothetical protein